MNKFVPEVIKIIAKIKILIMFAVNIPNEPRKNNFNASFSDRSFVSKIRIVMRRYAEAAVHAEMNVNFILFISSVFS